MSGKGLNDSLVIILEQPIQTWKHNIVPRKRLNLCCPVIRNNMGNALAAQVQPIYTHWQNMGFTWDDIG